MPTYQYRCSECGNDVEVVQKFSDAPLTECQACGGRLRKVYNAVGVVFKGSGFYRTDSRAEKGSAEGAPKEKPGGADRAESTGTGKDGAKTNGPAKTNGAGEGAGKGAGKTDRPATTNGRERSAKEPATAPSPARSTASSTTS